MIAIRRRNERGHFHHGWLETYHMFSFGDYYDPAHMGFRSLRVMNEDWIAPGQGFGTHPHRDMEIVTYVLEGELSHRDSLGMEGTIRPGELQRITAGTGITHSEFNPSAESPTHLYQIWLLPERRGLTPGYEQGEIRRGPGRRLAAAPPGAGGALSIRQDARIWLSDLGAGEILDHSIAPGRYAWLQILRGTIEMNETRLEAGDGAAFAEEELVRLAAVGPAETMLFDLA